MFQPGQAACVAWTSACLLGSVFRHSDIDKPNQAAVRRSPRDEGHIRELAFVAGFAVLLLVLAIFLLATSSPTNSQALVVVTSVLPEAHP